MALAARPRLAEERHAGGVNTCAVVFARDGIGGRVDPNGNFGGTRIDRIQDEFFDRLCMGCDGDRRTKETDMVRVESLNGSSHGEYNTGFRAAPFLFSLCSQVLVLGESGSGIKLSGPHPKKQPFFQIPASKTLLSGVFLDVLFKNNGFLN